jgi:hypothetical protein
MYCLRYCDFAAEHRATVANRVVTSIFAAVALTLSVTLARAQCGGGTCSEGSSGCGQHGASSSGTAMDHQSHAHHGLREQGASAVGQTFSPPPLAALVDAAIPG